jgi:hypothetical protein
MHGPLNVKILRHYCSIVAYNTIPHKLEFKVIFFVVTATQESMGPPYKQGLRAFPMSGTRHF